MLTAGCLSASAQEADTKEVFNPHWYVQAQAGIQNTLGEVKAKDLISGNAQIAAGCMGSTPHRGCLAEQSWSDTQQH